MTPLTELKGFAAHGPLVHLLLDPLAATRSICAAHGELTALRPSMFKRRAPIIHVVGAIHAEQARSAILFGPERSGLETDDVALARTIITVPINPEFASLNLAQAVLLQRPDQLHLSCD